MRRSVGLLVLGACVAGCVSSPPMRFYTLSPIGGGSGSNENARPSIQVARVSLPGEIDRPEIVQRLDANRVKLADEDRWAAPLGEMIRRTLSADLQSRVPAATGDPALLYVEIDELIGGADCAVTLRAGWTLNRPGGQPTSRGYETVHVDPPQTCQVSALPEAMSRALAELGSRVAAAGTK